MNYLKNELSISGKDFIKFICHNANKEKHPYIYSTFTEKTNNWLNDMLKGKGRSIVNLKYSDVYLDIEAIIFLETSENYDLFYEELKSLVESLIGKDKFAKRVDVITEIFNYQKFRMSKINSENEKLNFKYNIAEYLFFLNTKRKVKLIKHNNSIQIVNAKNYKDNYWEFTKKKVIWGRKSDKIKNEIDYDNKNFKKMKKSIDNIKNEENLTEKKRKVVMFDKINKFDKYDSLPLKNNRRIHK